MGWTNVRPIRATAIGAVLVLAGSTCLAQSSDPSPPAGSPGPALPAAVLQVITGLTPADADPTALAERELVGRRADRETLGLAGIDPSLPDVLNELDQVGSDLFVKYLATLVPPGPDASPSPDEETSPPPAMKAPPSPRLVASIAGGLMTPDEAPDQAAGLSLVWGVGYLTALAILKEWQPQPGSGTISTSPYRTSGTTSVGGQSVPYDAEMDSSVSIDQGRVTVTTEFTMTSSATTAGDQGSAQIKEHGRFSVAVNPCPFPDGQVFSTAEATSDESVTASQGGPGYSVHNEATSRGFTSVDGAAEVAGTRLESTARRTASGTRRSAAGDDTIDSDVGYAVTETADGAVGSKVTQSRGSEADLIAAAKGAGGVAQASIAGLVDAARSVWRGGRCLEMTVTPKGKSVDAGSATPITVSLRHRVDDHEVPLPVKATLAGTESIAPADEPHPAPADFTYTATSKPKGEGSVTFRSVSNRGIVERVETYSVSSSPAAFMATFKAVQKDHIGSALTWTMNPPSAGCSSGETSYSTDQVMTVTSKPVPVEVATLDAPNAAWGGQTLLIVPRGGSTAGVLDGPPPDSLYDAPIVLELPSNVTINKSFTQPGTGQMPQPRHEEYEGGCSSGDPGEGDEEPPQPDCGRRDFQTTMVLVAAGPSTLQSYTQEDGPDDLYEDCPVELDTTVARFMVEVDDSVENARKDAAYPTADKIADTSIPSLTLKGDATMHFDGPGNLVSSEYQWTLTLCRIVDDKPAC